MAASEGAAPRILIVDDDQGVRESLAQALMLQAGFEVAIACDAFEAGYRLAAFRPQVVILYVVMPGMGGLDICERMRRLARGRRLKIIILTGYPGIGAQERSLLSGADLFLTKPPDLAALAQHVKELTET